MGHFSMEKPPNPGSVLGGNQHAEIIEKWGRAVTVERFFTDATERLKSTDGERRQRLEERLTLARAMLESVDPLDFIEVWKAPEERHRSKFL